MAKKQENLFSKLSRLFKSGPVVKRKIASLDTRTALPDKFDTSSIEFFQKSTSQLYSAITSNAYNNSERLMRYNDFNEMEYTAEIASALDIYADETCAVDDKGRALHIYSDNANIKRLLEELFYDTLNVEFNLRMWTRNLVKYGDFFLFNDVHPDYGVLNVVPIPVNEIEREEGFDRNDPLAVRYRWVSQGNKVIENWQITHMRLLGNDMFLPYGSSVIEPARRIWRQLILIEDAMLVYRIVRAPDRRVFYIDVGNIEPEAIPNYIEQQRTALRTNQVIDRSTGRVDLRYNPLSVDEDFFIPVRGGDTGTKIDTLAGGQNTAAVEDVEYIQKKLFAALKVPRAYLGYDEMLSSKATLAQEDIRFSRTIQMIQRTIVSELNKLAIIHLFSHGFSGEDLVNFTLKLSNPSAVAQQQKLELYKSKFEIASLPPDGLLSKEYILKNVLGMTEDEISENLQQLIDDKMVAAKLEAMGASVGTETGGGGGAKGAGPVMTPTPAGGGGEESSEVPEEPEAAAGGEAPPENAGKPEKEKVLITSNTDHLSELDLDEDDYEELYIKKGQLKDKELPVKLTKQQRLKYNGKRRRVTKHMPDFYKMADPNMGYTGDVTGISDLGKLNEIFEEDKVPVNILTVKPQLTNDLRDSLARMGKNWGWTKDVSTSSNILTENDTFSELFLEDDEQKK